MITYLESHARENCKKKPCTVQGVKAEGYPKSTNPYEQKSQFQVH